MKREQAVLNSLFVVIALMFTTTAFAKNQCQSIKGETISDIQPILASILDRVELVPPEEADYLRKEDRADKGPDFAIRLKALQDRRFYAAVMLGDYIASLKQKVEAAEHSTAAKDVARQLIEVLSGMSDLFSYVLFFKQSDDKRKQPTASSEDKSYMLLKVERANRLTADILQCVVKGL